MDEGASLVLRPSLIIIRPMRFIDALKNAGDAFMNTLNNKGSQAEDDADQTLKNDQDQVEDKTTEDTMNNPIDEGAEKEESTSEDNEPPVDSVVEDNPDVSQMATAPVVKSTNKPDLDKPEIRLKTSASLGDNSYVVGFSIQGRSHIMMGTPCQDYHAFENLGKGWFVAITSDGAGSAREAARGSKANCELATRLIKQLLAERKWIENEYLPSEKEWYIEIKNIFEVIQAVITRSASSQVESYKEELDRKLKSLIDLELKEEDPETRTKLQNKIETLKDSIKTPLEARDFNATIILLLVSPKGMMAAHIGDGRMGYLSNDGKWKSLMTPHKGDEASSTVFIPNNWNRQLDVPIFKMSDVFLPETRIVEEYPKAFVLMSDGCESFSWTCKVYDKEKNYYYDRNEPFERFLTPLINAIGEIKDKDKRIDEMIEIINIGTVGGKKEQDDRTMLLGVL